MMIDRHFERIESVVKSVFPHFKEDVVCVDIQNVFDAFYLEDDTKRPRKKSDFPNIAPPWPLFWLEYHGTLSDNKVKSTVGVLMGVPDPGRSLAKEALATGRAEELKSDKIKWISEYFCFIEHRELGKARPMLVGYEPIDSQGKAISDAFHSFLFTPEGLGPIGEKDLGALWLLFPVLMALSLCHCKNVAVLHKDISSKLEKKRIKKGGRPFFRFKTLDILPMKKVLVEEGSLGKTGLKMALHLCRGHFKDYQNGRGLFGKLKGLYWWDMQARGDLKEGAVIKDYSIKAPEGNGAGKKDHDQQ